MLTVALQGENCQHLVIARDPQDKNTFSYWSDMSFN